jgi:hypothetical protein
MKNTYVKRTIEPVVRQAAREFPAVVLTGPRQSGKDHALETYFRREVPLCLAGAP